MSELRFIPPLLPTPVSDPPAGDGWLHEIKHDGYRTQLIKDGASVRAFTRNGHDWTAKYANIVKAAASLPCDRAIIDGELIVQDENGVSDFRALRASLSGKPHGLILYAFDLLHLDGKDLRKVGLIDRRDSLRALIGGHDPKWPLQFSEHVVGNGDAMFAQARVMELEGIVSKRIDSRYVSGRSTAWLKVKCFEEENFVVVGTERGTGPTTALLAREHDGELEYVGGAMLTLSDNERDRFWADMERLKRLGPPLRVDKRKGAQWVEPEVHARVQFLRGGGKLRHATVRGLL